MLLPLELINHICEHLPPSQLAKVATCASSFCDTARRILYKNVNIRSHSQVGIDIICTLATNHSVASHVRQLNVVIDASSLDTVCDGLAAALRHMEKLESLSISTPTMLSSSAIFRQNDSTTYPGLHTLHVSFTLDLAIVKFLETTPELLALSVGQQESLHVPCPDVPQLSIPKLTRFQGSISAALKVVPGRPVHSILAQTENLSVGHVRTLRLSSVPVLRLDISIANSPIPIVKALVEAMPYLQQVRITTTYEPSPGTGEIHFMQDLKVAAADLLDIQLFEFFGPQWRWFNRAAFKHPSTAQRPRSSS
ncbi:hypothetical protein NMY22_g8982 [Coprinellus aureogranulatus]|nr:hypothetical protein NMY22_g8982 [Coprinellus aureogranulatus]